MMLLDSSNLTIIISNSCFSKKKGSFGIKDLRKMNIGLLCKWWWLPETKEGLWQDIVKLNYVKQNPICLIPNIYSDSPI
jgi:hypothetical protein